MVKKFTWSQWRTIRNNVVGSPGLISRINSVLGNADKSTLTEDTVIEINVTADRDQKMVDCLAESLGFTNDEKETTK